MMVSARQTNCVTNQPWIVDSIGCLTDRSGLPSNERPLLQGGGFMDMFGMMGGMMENMVSRFI